KPLGLHLKHLDSATVETHYGEHSSKPFFGELCGFMTGGPVVIAAFEGPHAISVTRKLVGATKGYEADPGTIRGDYGLSNQSNLIHASDSPESAERELKLFFPNADFVEFTSPDEKWW
ncbi:MAG: nucleoside-diphosphate kinase, partial [Planctomycetota bacterium]